MVAAGSGVERAFSATDVLEEFLGPTDRAEAERDLCFGQKAVVIHRGEDWPAGRVCRNCHEPWPCRLHRWGLRVLVTAGWGAADVAQLVARAETGDVPW
jgi:hypothetical protein